MGNIADVVLKGLAIMETLQQAGKSILPAIQALTNLVTKDRDGTITDADLDATERLLDSLITDFNAPID